MKKYSTILLTIIILLFIITGCTNNLYSNKVAAPSTVTGTVPEKSEETSNADSTSGIEQENLQASEKTQNDEQAQNSQDKESIVVDYSKVKPDESGQIMVVMFHNFVENYPKGKNEYTTTFSEFEKLLPELYEKNYRLISLTDMLNNNIDVPAGCIPMVFTFDDGTSGQFNLIKKDGKLVANPKSAVGIMQAFSEKHPDFGLKGTFYVNLGVSSTFSGEGTLAERLNYLNDNGFEIGNHTKTHVSLPSVKTVQKMLEEVGGNQKLMNEFIPGYSFNSFSLPFGNASKDLKEYVIKGNYEGTEYKNSAIVLVGANPAPSPVSAKFNPFAIPRVRSTGMEKVECDLAWWIDALSKGKSQYISDGNSKTVSVPASKVKNVDMSKLNGKQLISY